MPTCVLEVRSQASCRSLLPEGCVWSISLSIPNLGLVCSLLSCDVCSELPSAIMGATICNCDYYEHSQYDPVSFVLKVSVHFRV